MKKFSPLEKIASFAVTFGVLSFGGLKQTPGSWDFLYQGAFLNVVISIGMSHLLLAAYWFLSSPIHVVSKEMIEKDDELGPDAAGDLAIAFLVFCAFSLILGAVGIATAYWCIQATSGNAFSTSYYGAMLTLPMSLCAGVAAWAIQKHYRSYFPRPLFGKALFLSAKEAWNCAAAKRSEPSSDHTPSS